MSVCMAWTEMNLERASERCEQRAAELHERTQADDRNNSTVYTANELGRMRLTAGGKTRRDQCTP